uniref:Uncharacterized protein n=1 Tax=Chromera velia CCMP2878 TaxID=1169474 RepID=A0A0G4HNZ7_9ALVE|eukprot:Cvel_1208.t1-p1 / transcript=Cvel_1208.t1 / gene=Cvel_1208 / organism=Chromera_velia_CCMP2878 / gene_product=Probable phospholipid-transporting ATPase IC, putative / transcript_product=Probable phospholipid-transporting ATPase IC, putative / location=Cvel_scaffold40:46209-58482(-) / protein_length=1652 / sequence_SO=supercontig / SO=protein_coding / is_pseudo=false
MKKKGPEASLFENRVIYPRRPNHPVRVTKVRHPIKHSTRLNETIAVHKNDVRTTKYTLLTWIPTSLFYQFRRSANIYFLVVVVLTFLPFSPKHPAPIAATFGFVVFFAVMKDGYEDWQRRRQDTRENRAECRRFSFEKRDWEEETQRGQVHVGDVVLLRSNETVPADLLCLASSDADEGIVFVDTANLDGETNLKRKKAVGVTHHEVMTRCDCVHLERGVNGQERGVSEAAPMSSGAAAAGVILVSPSSVPGSAPSPPVSPSQSPQAAVTLPPHRPEESPQQQVQRAGTGGSAEDADPHSHAPEWDSPLLAHAVDSLDVVVKAEHPHADVAVFRGSLVTNPGLRGRSQSKVPDELAPAVAKRQPSPVKGQRRDNRASTHVTPFQRCGLSTGDHSAGRRRSGSLNLEKHPEVSLGADSLLFRGCVVRNTKWVLGVVVYAGAETKIRMNANEAPTKVSRLSRSMNELLGGVFCFLFGACALYAGLGLYWETTTGVKQWYLRVEGEDTAPRTAPSVLFFLIIRFFTVLVAIAHLIPISLYVVMEVLKLLLTLWINTDEKMEDANGIPSLARTSDVVEELGQAEFLFSDKTGTLTCNSMEFAICHVDGKSFGHVHAMSPRSSQAGGRETRRGEGGEGIGSSPGGGDREGAQSGSPHSPSDAEEDRELMRQNARAHLPDGPLRGYLFDLPPATAEAGEAVEKPTQLPSSSSSASASADSLLRFFALLALCHSVLPGERKKEEAEETEKEEGDKGEGKGKKQKEPEPEFSFEGASPDEVALVLAAAQRGIVLKTRGKRKGARWETMRLDILGVEHLFECRETLGFSSDRKRMTVVVEHRGALGSEVPPGEGKFYCLTKGADSVMGGLLSSEGGLRADDKQALSAFSRQGLRTLIMASKPLTLDEYAQWSADHLSATVQIEGRELAEEEVAKRMETDLRLAGISAVEDKLQDDVPQTIFRLKDAGLRVFVLTGDKLETAVDIGFSCQLLDNEMSLHTIAEGTVSSVEEAKKALVAVLEDAQTRVPDFYAHPPQHIDLEGAPTSGAGGCRRFDWFTLGLTACLCPRREKKSAIRKEFDRLGHGSHQKKGGQMKKPRRIGLAIDGQTLSLCLADDEITDIFLRVCLAVSACLCCRLSPRQKALLVRLVRRGTGLITVAVGDGANDVPMIQEAHVGVGIRGKEGTQAVQSSDYAIPQFKCLQRLILVHGRKAYRRIATMLNWYFYKQVVIVVCDLAFNLFSGFSGQVFFPDWLSALYVVFFTSLVCLATYAVDVDVPDEIALALPVCYLAGSYNAFFSDRVFWAYMFAAVYHGAASFFVPVFGLLYFGDASGRPEGFWYLSCVSFTLCVLIVNYKLILYTYSWAWPQWAMLVFTLVFYFLALSLLSINPLSTIFQWNIFGIAGLILSRWLPLIVVILGPVVILVPDFVVERLRLAFFATPLDIVMYAVRTGKGEEVIQRVGKGVASEGEREKVKNGSPLAAGVETDTPPLEAARGGSGEGESPPHTQLELTTSAAAPPEAARELSLPLDDPNPRAMPDQRCPSPGISFTSASPTHTGPGRARTAGERSIRSTFLRRVNVSDEGLEANLSPEIDTVGAAADAAERGEAGGSAFDEDGGGRRLIPVQTFHTAVDSPTALVPVETPRSPPHDPGLSISATRCKAG